MIEDIVAKAHQDWSWGGAYFNSHHALARDALAVAPADPIVLYRCLQTWRWLAMPIKWWGEHGAEATQGLERALVAAEQAIARPDRSDTVAERLLTFWTKLHLALRLIGADTRPTPQAIAEADRLCNEVATLLFETPHIGEIDKRYDWQFWMWVALRRRAWMAIEAGPPYPDWMVDKLGYGINYQDNCLGWPLRPLTTDPTFRAHITAQLAERTRARTHPPAPRSNGATIAPMAEIFTKRDDPTPDETLGRLLLVLWLGADQESITALAERLVWDPTLELLTHVLSLGIAPKPDVLHHAIELKQPALVRALVRAGVAIDRKAKLAATKTKHKATIAALSGTASAGDPALAERLRAAASALDAAELSWVGSNFGLQQVDAVAIVDRVLAKQPSSPQEVLASGGSHPFDDYVLVRALRAAGHVIDIKKKGTWKTASVVTSGDVIVDGALIDELGGGWIAVGGDLVVDSLITEADVIVGGALRAKTLVWGNYNDGSLVVNGTVDTPRLVMTDHTFECRANEDLEPIDEDEAAALFVPAMLDDGSIDRERVIKAARAGKPFLVGAKAKPAAAAKPAKKPAAKKPAKKPAAKKAAAKKAPAKKAPARTAKPGAKKSAKGKRR